MITARRFGVCPRVVDAGELRRGVQVEMEHTTDPQIARKIACDHLREFPDYYSRLSRMEEEARRAWKK